VALSLIIGLGILAFLFLYFAFNLDRDHFLLKLFLIFFFCATIMLIPNASINDSCSTVLANETTVGNTTLKAYTEFCTPGESTSTETNFLRIVLWWFRIFVMYFSLYLFYHWAKSAEVFTKWFGRGKD
jgi:hypothetical protein